MTIRSRFLCSVTLLLLGLLLSGCAGARTLITADNLQHPVSLTQAVCTQKGEVVVPAKHQVAAHFKLSFSAWSILWTMIQFSPIHDVSDVLEAEIAKHKGSAIINLKITATEDYTFALTSLIPIFPHAVHYTLEGDVVRLLP